MLFLLMVPVVIGVAWARRLLQMYAPTNVLVARVRTRRPTIRVVAALTALALGLLTVGHAVSLAIENGAPGWLNLIVLVLMWDSIKLGLLAGLTAARWAVVVPGAPKRSCRSGQDRRFLP